VVVAAQPPVRQNALMAVAPHAAPMSVAARPEATGGRRIGVLLSHGFTGSPFSMRPWGWHLANLGYAVEIPRLPGHGTSVREMNRTGWADWHAELVRALDKLSTENDAVVLGGLSMGGALVLRLAADHADRVSGVVVVNPAVASNRKDLIALPVVKHLVSASPGLTDDIAKQGVTEHGYDRVPLKALASLLQGWRALRADLYSVEAPVLYFRSTTDHVVDDSSEPIITGSVSSTEVVVHRLEQSFHVATLDYDAPVIFAESANFVARVTAA
jgi:carboxylesterase